jgi:hypothetical protein
MFGSIVRRTKLYTVFTDLSKGFSIFTQSKTKDLKATTVRKDQSVPVLKSMHSPKLFDNILSRMEMQMKCIVQN